VTQEARQQVPAVAETLSGLPRAFLRDDQSLGPQLTRRREKAAMAAGQTLPAVEGMPLNEVHEEKPRGAAFPTENQINFLKQARLKVWTIRGFAAEAEAAASVRLAHLKRA
jgi:hypothetical protein